MMASVDTSAFTGLLTAVAKELNDHGVYGIGDVVFSAEMFARGAQKRRRETRSNACSQPSVPGNTDSNSDSSEQLFMPKRIRHSNSLSKGRTSAFHAFTSSGPAERGAADVWGTVRSPHSGLCREASPSPRFSGNDSPELHRLLDRAESRDSDVSHGEQHTVKQELQAWTLPTASRRDDIQSRLTSASGLQEKPCGTSGFRGVSWHTQTQRWKAQIKVGGKDINLGRHRDEEAAARAYDRAAICARGLAGAKLNFPAECYEAEAEALSVTPLETLAATLRGVEARLQAQTSRFHGVRLNKRTAKWEAYIRVAGKHVHLGCYDSEVAAAQAFDQAAIVRHTRHPGPANQKPAFLLNYSCSCYQSFLAALGVPESSLPEAKPPLAVNNRTGSRTITVVAPLEEKYIANLVTKCRGDGSDSTR